MDAREAALLTLNTCERQGGWSDGALKKQLAAAFFQKFRTSKVMSYIMKIVKPVCIGMVLGVLVGLCRQTYITEAGGISLPGIAIGILCFVLLQKFKLSVPKVIGIAAVLGLVCFGVF